ncbi:DNA-binding response regulator [Primorskyibacter flagellatus]|uniref:DNA-binding response regulator n=1 Tax=Primorskyibacter flagellatus TaxID=1387277 RepID=A0A917AAL7_9RHOB|nr:response regulator transcription factor [Primorskyibacter flagellatus]GGE35398.1 DNA-binding response regulator [Primorskyibacter flagellatus]
MRILITDTTWTMAALAHDLHEAGFLVTLAADGAELLEYLRTGQQDAVLIDPDLPDMAARDLLRQVRETDARVPLCLVQAGATPPDRQQAMTEGADDVIDWPRQAGGDLMAQLRAYVRRARGFARPEIGLGGLTLDLDLRQLRAGGTLVPLTRLEYEIVESLALRRGAVMTREEIMLQLYAWQDEPDAKILDVYLCRIRSKLALAGAADSLIATSYSHGYRLAASPEGLALAA